MKLVRWFVLFFGLFLIGLSLWTNRYFGYVTVDQVLSTISFSAHGVLAADPVFIKRFIEWCIFWPLVVLALIYGLSRVAAKLKWSVRVGSKPHLAVLLLGLALAINQYHLVGFVAGLFGSKQDSFSPMYVDPAKITFKTKQPKSLVLIYVESLETTYSNKTLFNRDLLASLNAVTSSDIHFKHYRQMPGADWTIAGIVSTQCGIPLRMVTIFEGNRIGQNINHYLPGAKCLSDILAEHGYKNVFMNGPELEFAGVNVFLRDHHYTESYGKGEWLKNGMRSSDMEGWGLQMICFSKKLK
jgi:phosphoglycerol transferase